MQVGIIGLPNAGKSTIFNALTRSSAQVADYPFCTIEPNIGVIQVPDEALVKLQQVYDSKKITPASIQVKDVAGLVKGASRGEGLGNKFLSHIRTVDAIVMVLRCFDDPSSEESPIDPLDDIDILKTELMLSDLEISERKKEKLKITAKSQDPDALKQLKTLESLVSKLDGKSPLGFASVVKEERQMAKATDLLSFKPILYVANVGDGISSEHAFRKLSSAFGIDKVIKINAKLELEILELPEEERAEYRKELGIDSFNIEIFIKACYELLDLITFYTINENETRAWAIKQGSSVYDASGKIHTDMQKGFIKAEVINYIDMLEAGSMAKAREKGKVRIEGRDHIVNDKDIIQIRFSS